MGLEIIEGPMGGNQSAAGMFTLPPTFDPRQHAGKWVEEASVPWAKQREPIVGTNLSADGWEIWKNGEEGAKSKPTIVTDGKGRKYVLMFRSRKLQDEVNALYGNVSKKAINREVQGETVQGAAKQDAGILTEAELARQGGGGSLADESVQTLNPVSTPSAQTET